jgi:hypothetical protein
MFCGNLEYFWHLDTLTEDYRYRDAIRARSAASSVTLRDGGPNAVCAVPGTTRTPGEKERVGRAARYPIAAAAGAVSARLK